MGPLSCSVICWLARKSYQPVPQPPTRPDFDFLHPVPRNMFFIGFFFAVSIESDFLQPVLDKPVWVMVDCLHWGVLMASGVANAKQEFFPLDRRLKSLNVARAIRGGIMLPLVWIYVYGGCAVRDVLVGLLSRSEHVWRGAGRLLWGATFAGTSSGLLERCLGTGTG